MEKQGRGRQKELHEAPRDSVDVANERHARALLQMKAAKTKMEKQRNADKVPNASQKIMSPWLLHVRK